VQVVVDFDESTRPSHFDGLKPDLFVGVDVVNPMNILFLPRTPMEDTSWADHWLASNLTRLCQSGGYNGIQPFMASPMWTDKESEELADYNRMKPGHRAQLVCAIRNIPRAWSRDIAADSVEEWLTSMGLDEFVKESIERGYNDLCIILHYPHWTEENTRDWARTVGMAPGHTTKLVVRWREATGVPRWLKSIDLEEFADQSIELGYDDMALIMQDPYWNEDYIREWGTLVGMDSAQIARFVTQWGEGRNNRMKPDPLLASLQPGPLLLPPPQHTGLFASADPLLLQPPPPAPARFVAQATQDSLQQKRAREDDNVASPPKRPCRPPSLPRTGLEGLDILAFCATCGGTV
jgi:hypothetical protein